MRRRDAIALLPRRTSKISTRRLMIDPAIAGLAEAIEAIDVQACALLGCDDVVPF